MNKIILCKLYKKSNYKEIENVEQESLEENKIITNNECISEKKSYIQLLDKIKTSLVNSDGTIKDISATIIHMYDNYEEQLLGLHKLLNNTVFDEKKIFCSSIKKQTGLI